MLKNAIIPIWLRKSRILHACIFIILILLAALLSKRWIRNHFFLDSKVSIESGCIDVDTMIWNEIHETKTLCVDNFKLDRYEATYKFYYHPKHGVSPNHLQFKGSSGETVFIDDAPDLPAGGISWNDAYQFCKERAMRLPTADEWEYAARSGHTGIYIADPKTTIENLEGEYKEDIYPAISPVGSFASNEFGLYDMIGNIKEWTGTCRNESGELMHPDSVIKADWKEYIECEVGGGDWNMSRSLHFPTTELTQNDYNSLAFGVRCAQ